MSLLALASALTLLAYGAASLVGNLAAAPFLRSALRASDPASRARRILFWRLFPTVLALVVALGIVLPAFLRHEPAATEERVGAGLLAGAAVSLALILAGGFRWAAGTLATRRIVERWRRTAEPLQLEGIAAPAFAVDDPFPIVALAGSVRPTLYVSRRVLAHCSEAELSAIVEHEAGHVRRGDPWSRVLLRACPDAVACIPLGFSVERAWEEAAELAADDQAASGDPGRTLELASALLAVARLAGASSPGPLPLLALYRGGGVVDRVERLLRSSGTTAPDRSRKGRLVALAALGIVVVIGSGPALHDGVHRLLEAVVALAH